jgi:hypothetical protein
MLVLKLLYRFGFNIGGTNSNYICHAFKSTYWKRKFQVSTTSTTFEKYPRTQGKPRSCNKVLDQNVLAMKTINYVTM